MHEWITSWLRVLVLVWVKEESANVSIAFQYIFMVGFMRETKARVDDSGARLKMIACLFADNTVLLEGKKQDDALEDCKLIWKDEKKIKINK